MNANRGWTPINVSLEQKRVCKSNREAAFSSHLHTWLKSVTFSLKLFNFEMKNLWSFLLIFVA
jgi:hypothetical protein